MPHKAESWQVKNMAAISKKVRRTGRKPPSSEQMQQILEVLSDLARQHGASPPTQAGDGGDIAMALDDRFIVHVRPAGADVLLIAWLGDLPAVDSSRQRVLRRLMRAELAQFGGEDIILSVDEDSGELSLHAVAPAADFDLESLRRLLQALVDRVMHYRGLLAEPSRTLPPAPMIIRP